MDQLLYEIALYSVDHTKNPNLDSFVTAICSDIHIVMEVTDNPYEKSTNLVLIAHVPFETM